MTDKTDPLLMPGMLQLTKNFEHVAGMVLKDNYDWLHLSSGMERSGKSVFSLWLAKILSERSGLKFDWKGLSTVFFDEANLDKKLMNVPNGSVVILDEAGENLFSRKSITSQQINLVQTLMAYGSKNIFLILNIPSWRFIDKFVRVSRIKSLAIVKTQPRVVAEGEGQRHTRGRGYFSLYTRSNVLKASRVIAGQEGKLRNPAFFGYFHDFKTYYPREWEVYNRKKWDYLNRKGKEKKIDLEAEKDLGLV